MIEVGKTGRECLTVTEDWAISFLGVDEGRVLSTPNMILWMERVSRNTLKQCLDDEHDSLGTKVNIEHLKAAPLGSIVIFDSTVASVDGRRVEFDVSAKLEDGLVIGSGKHERTVINVPRFLERLRSRQTGQKKRSESAPGRHQSGDQNDK